MTLVNADQLQDLIIHWPDLARDRRELLVDFMCSLSPAELDEMISCEETPSDEVPFIRACCGLPQLELTRHL